MVTVKNCKEFKSLKAKDVLPGQMFKVYLSDSEIYLKTRDFKEGKQKRNCIDIRTGALMIAHDDTDVAIVYNEISLEG